MLRPSGRKAHWAATPPVRQGVSCLTTCDHDLRIGSRLNFGLLVESLDSLTDQPVFCFVVFGFPVFT